MKTAALVLLLLAGLALAGTNPPVAYDATSTPQLIILGGKVATNNEDILIGPQFYQVSIYADDTEDATYSIWRLVPNYPAVGDTTWILPDGFTVRGDTIGTVSSGIIATTDLAGADAVYISSGKGTLVVE